MPHLATSATRSTAGWPSSTRNYTKRMPRDSLGKAGLTTMAPLVVTSKTMIDAVPISMVGAVGLVTIRIFSLTKTKMVETSSSKAAIMEVEETPATLETTISSVSNNRINRQLHQKCCQCSSNNRRITTSNSSRPIFSNRSEIPDNHINRGASKDNNNNNSSRSSTRADSVVEKAISLAVRCLCTPQEDPKLLTLATILTWATVLTHTKLTPARCSGTRLSL